MVARGVAPGEGLHGGGDLGAGGHAGVPVGGRVAGVVVVGISKLLGLDLDDPRGARAKGREGRREGGRRRC